MTSNFFKEVSTPFAPSSPNLVLCSRKKVSINAMSLCKFWFAKFGLALSVAFAAINWQASATLMQCSKHGSRSSLLISLLWCISVSICFFKRAIAATLPHMDFLKVAGAYKLQKSKVLRKSL